MYVTGCWDVRDALTGKDATVGALYATEIGMGEAVFHNSKLVRLVFSIKAAQLDDVIAAVTKELGDPSPTMSVETLQNGFGATLQQRKAVWNSESLTVWAAEIRSFEYGT